MSSRILIIEDNRANLELMNYLLTAFGYSTLTATDGEMGMKAASGEQIDLIICDVHMPKLDGYEVARRVKAHPELVSVPIIAVTAMAMVGDREKVLAAGFDGYIAKPLEPESFVQQVKNIIKLSQKKPGDSKLVESIKAPESRLVVVVADHDPATTELTRKLLEPRGYTVISFSTIAETLEYARCNLCDLIVANRNMTTTEEVEMLRNLQIHENIRSIPCVFLSLPHEFESDKVFDLKLSTIRYLARPVEPEDFLSVIQMCLRETGRLAHGDNIDRG